jgi:hypothetical protein
MPREPDADPFLAAEQRTRALVGAAWWPAAQPIQRFQAIAAHTLTLPDGSWWVFGAGGRWYRLHPADRRWYMCPPPEATLTRRAARGPAPGPGRAPATPPGLRPGPGPAAPPGSGPGSGPGQPPRIPPALLPAGPDLAAAAEPPVAVAGEPVPDNITFQLRQILSQAASAPADDYPLKWSFFDAGTPSTVAAAWAAMLWCARVPVFDGDASMLELWRPYLAAPLPGQGGLRWLMPPPLGSIAAVYAERLRAGRADAAGQLARFMVMTARALREDARFRFRADALLAMAEPILSRPDVDGQALGYGDRAVERRWMDRCPPSLAAALSWDTAPGERFAHAWYDLATAVRPLCGQPDSPGFVEPRAAATALLAADMAGYRPDLAGEVGGWLDPEARELLGTVLGEPGHALRTLWPVRGRLPETLPPVNTETLAVMLGAAAEMDLCWCRIAGGGVPIPPDGFAVPDACAMELAERRARRPSRERSAADQAPVADRSPVARRRAQEGPGADAAPDGADEAVAGVPGAGAGQTGADGPGAGRGDGGAPEADPLEDEAEGAWTRMWGS